MRQATTLPPLPDAGRGAPATGRGAAGPAGRPRRQLFARRAGSALAAGAVLLLAFPPYGFWPLAPLAVALLALACRTVRPRLGAGLGLLTGVVFFVLLLFWTRLVGDDAWLALALCEAGFFAVLGAALAVVSRLPGQPVWIGCLWVAAELVRDRVPFGGMPWGRLAFSQAGSPYARLAALGGAPLVTFAVALTGGFLAATVTGLARRRRRGSGLAGGLAAVVALPLAGLLVHLPTGGTTAGGPAAVTVAVIQGNVPRLGLGAFDQRLAVLRNHAAQTRRLAAEVRAGRLPAPQLVVWPENSSDFDPIEDPVAGAMVASAARDIGVPILVGAVLDGGPHFVRNSGVVWDPRTGPGEIYVKRHPVPFAEYVPFRPVLTRLVGRFAMVPRDFRAGRRAGVLTVGPARLGDVICFEVAYDNLVRDAVRSGGRMIVVQTNNATFGRSAETHQQLAMSRIRAIEHGRAVLVAATSGVSAVIAPDGAVRQRSAVFTPALLVARVPLRDPRTLADRLGAWPEWVLGSLGAAAVLAGVLPATRRRRPAADESTAPVAA